MKLPAATKDITLGVDGPGRPYPPLGFVPFFENELGNGDHFGLYWPIGCEDMEPLVAEMHHDSWTMSPSFSSLPAFLRAARDPDAWVEPPTLEQDELSPLANLSAAKQALSAGMLDNAALFLRQAVRVLPEYGEAQWTLSRLLLRTGEADAAVEAACAAVLAPPSWGGASLQALEWLKRQKNPEAAPAMKPLWERRLDLTYRFGGSKTNNDYLVLRDLIDSYIRLGDGHGACILMQTYGELMLRETTSFQERYNFTAAAHVDEQILVARRFGMDRDARGLNHHAL